MSTNGENPIPAGGGLFGQLLQLSRESVIYGLSSAASQIVGFFLIPLYTHYLTTDQYGVLEILNTTLPLLAIIFTMGLTAALFRTYFKYQDDASRRKVASTILVFLTVTSALLTGLLLLLAGHFSTLIFHSSDYAMDFRLVFLTLFFNTGSAIAFSVFRARRQPTRYALASIAQFLISITLNIVFVIGLHTGIRGILEGNLIASALVYLPLTANLVKQCGLRLSTLDLKEMLAFGLPLVPAALGGWILVMADRYFLQFLSTPDQVGLYSLGYKFGLVIQAMVVGPIQLAWLPFLFSAAKGKESGRMYSRIFTYYILVILPIALAISVLSREVLAIMAEPSYYDAYKVIPMITLSYVLYGCFYMLPVGINLEAKTKYLALLVGGAAILNLGLNYALVPGHGMMGSAVATLICYALLPVGAYFISRRYLRVDYEWIRITKIIVAAAVIYAASLFAGRSYPLVHSHVTVGAFKLLILLTFPGLLYLLGFYRREEISKARELIGLSPAYAQSILRWGFRRLSGSREKPNSNEIDHDETQKP